MSIVNVKYLISYIFGLLTDRLVFKMSLDITLDHQHIRPKLMCALFPNKFEKKTPKKQKTTLKHTGFTKLRSDCKTRLIKYDSITAYFSPQIFSKIYLSDLFLTRPPSWKQMEEDREGHQNKEQRSSDVCDIILFSTHVAFLLDKLLKWLINYEICWQFNFHLAFQQLFPR